MRIIAFLFFLLCSSPLLAQNIQILDRGAHHRLVREARPDGGISEYVELKSGMSRFDSTGIWRDCVSVIELIGGAAVSRQAQAKVIWAANANSPGGLVDILSHGNRRFRISPVGLAYTSRTGHSVMIAGLRDTEGFVHENSVYYFDAFDGGFLVTIEIVQTLATIEQNIILEEAPPHPATLPEFAELLDEPGALDDIYLEVWNEVFEAPAPVIRETVVKSEISPARRAALAEPDVLDKRLEFGNGDVLIAGGRAFELGTSDPLGPRSVATIRDWVQAPDGRRFLVERVPYSVADAYLRTLPAPAAKVNKRPPPAQPQGLLARAFPPPPNGERKSWKSDQQASMRLPDKGFVLDWTLVTGLITNYLFTNTIYLSGECFLYGNTTFSSAVIKLAPTNSASLHVLGPATFDTEAARPLFITARDNHTVGEAVDTNALSATYYGARALHLDDFTPYHIKHVRFSHLDKAITFQYDTGHDHTLSHVQMEHCGFGLEQFNTTVRLRNVLMHDVGTNFYGHTYPSTNRCEHLTVNDSVRLNVNSATTRLYLTNTLLVAIDDLGGGYESGQSSHVEEVEQSSTVFLPAVGAGQHYTRAAYKNTGTTNISPTMAAELRELTTYPPQIMLNTEISMDTVWGRTVPRDMDLPDIGAAYFSLDYLIDTVRITNATLRIGEGVAVGSFGGIAFWLQDYSTFVCQGSPTRPNTLLRYYAVQEATTNRGTVAQAMLYGLNQSNSPPVVRLRFTDSYVAPGGGYHIYALNSGGWRFNQVEVRDCSLYGGTIYLSDRAVANYGFTNNLMRRMTLTASGSQTLAFCNNLWKDDYGTTLLPSAANIFLFFDNLLDTGTLKNLSANLVHQYNRFYQASNFYSTHALHATEQALGSLTYESLGQWNYYQPGGSLLINTGSVANAASIGFYHYTVQTNQTIEGTTQLDVGPHRIALDANGAFRDGDGDSVIDALEDVDGDGTADAGETNWQTYNSINGLSTTPGLVVFTPLRP